ncbi:MAG: GDYXXLXY domain-containing protein [Candidatus Omnitrophica bacterium]|nr:GDYXXLXY domain-containing protein [Candidatus Omnitrophota bacterium]
MFKRLLFVVLVIAQLSVPVSMIYSKERILKQGELLYFKTAPVDPYDIFRGRYVALNIDEQHRTFHDTQRQDIIYNQTIYVIYDRDSQGFAVVRDISTLKPRTKTYIRTRMSYRADKNSIHFSLPFDRFYMNENKAQRAEDLYRQNSRRDKQSAHIAVRVLNGAGVIEDLYIGGKPILDYF